jgi:microcystin degradation protein MlrC
LHGSVHKLGALLPSFRMRSDDAPMAGLLQQARQLEAGEAGADLSILGGFPYADTAFADAGVMAWARDAATATKCADSLLQSLREADFSPALSSPSEGVARACRLARQAKRMIGLTDPADNPLSGGAADTPGLLRELLAQRALWPQPADGFALVFAYFCDAALVQRVLRAGVGASLQVALGGRTSAAFGAPVEVSATVRRIGDGQFVNIGPMQKGQRVNAGASVLLDVHGIGVIVTSAVVPANDPAFFAALGIRLDQTRLLCVKAKNHFHAAFAPLCAAIVDVDCPGPAMADLSRLPFRSWRPSSPVPVRR